jgi:hypothetical protein
LGFGILQFTDDEELCRKSKNWFLTSNHDSEKSKEPVEEPTLNCWYLFHNPLSSLNFFHKPATRGSFDSELTRTKKPGTTGSLISKDVKEIKLQNEGSFDSQNFQKTQI